MSDKKPSEILSGPALRQQLAVVLSMPPSRAAMNHMATLVYEYQQELGLLRRHVAYWSAAAKQLASDHGQAEPSEPS